jgi:phage terminase small subunit
VPLTAKQERFVQEYLVDLNATQAAARAGYKNAEKGRQLVTNGNVSAAIQKAKAERQKRTEVTQDYVIEKLKEIADRPASDLPESDLKYANKLKALEMLAKHTGVFDKQDNTGVDSVVKVVIDV